MFNAKQRAEKGAKFFDSIRPKWEQSVNKKTLRMSHPRNCIAGQVLGHYSHLRYLILEEEDCANYGFNVNPLNWRSILCFLPALILYMFGCNAFQVAFIGMMLGFPIVFWCLVYWEYCELKEAWLAEIANRETFNNAPFYSRDYDFHIPSITE